MLTRCNLFSLPDQLGTHLQHSLSLDKRYMLQQERLLTHAVVKIGGVDYLITIYA